jgi:hypothetical protein
MKDSLVISRAGDDDLKEEHDMTGPAISPQATGFAVEAVFWLIFEKVQVRENSSPTS